MPGLSRIGRTVAVSAIAAALVLLAGVVINGTVGALSAARSKTPPPSRDASQAKSASALFLQGRQIFRYDTFGDQAFFGDALKLHQAIEGAKLGGVGDGVSPKTAL